MFLINNNSYNKGVTDTAAEQNIIVRYHTHDMSATGCYRTVCHHTCSSCGANYSHTENYGWRQSYGHDFHGCGTYACSTYNTKVCKYESNELVYLEVGGTVYVNK